MPYYGGFWVGSCGRVWDVIRPKMMWMDEVMKAMSQGEPDVSLVCDRVL